MFDKELFAEFQLEACDYVDEVEDYFLALEKNPNEISNIGKILKVLHGLRGSTRMFGLIEVEDIVHHIEDILLLYKEKNEVQIPKKLIDYLLDALYSVTEGIHKRNISFKILSFEELSKNILEPPIMPKIEDKKNNEIPNFSSTRIMIIDNDLRVRKKNSAKNCLTILSSDSHCIS